MQQSVRHANAGTLDIIARFDLALHIYDPMHFAFQ